MFRATLVACFTSGRVAYSLTLHSLCLPLAATAAPSPPATTRAAALEASAVRGSLPLSWSVAPGVLATRTGRRQLQ